MARLRGAFERLGNVRRCALEDALFKIERIGMFRHLIGPSVRMFRLDHFFLRFSPSSANNGADPEEFPGSAAGLTGRKIGSKPRFMRGPSRWPQATD